MVNTLVIPRISNKFNSDAIANTLWEFNICKVSRILLVPSSDNDENIAYIGVEQWLDCADFIVSLLENNRPVHIGFDNWTVLDASTFVSDSDKEVGPIKVTIYSDNYFKNITQALFMIASIS